MCRHHTLHGFLPDHNLDEPDYNKGEYEDRDAPQPTTMPNDLDDALWLIGTGKTLKDWGIKK